MWERTLTHIFVLSFFGRVFIDGQPAFSDVVKYHQHLQAEVESIVSARTAVPAPSPAIKVLGAGASGSSPSSPSTKPPCKYFLKPSGCRRGQRCPYTHEWASMSKPERAKKCLTCGSEEHRQKDCPTKFPKSGGRPAGAPHGQDTGTSSTTSMPTSAPRIQKAEFLKVRRP